MSRREVWRGVAGAIHGRNERKAGHGRGYGGLKHAGSFAGHCGNAGIALADRVWRDAGEADPDRVLGDLGWACDFAGAIDGRWIGRRAFAGRVGRGCWAWRWRDG